MSVKTRTVKPGAHLAVPLQDAVTQWLRAHAHRPTKNATGHIRRAVERSQRPVVKGCFDPAVPIRATRPDARDFPLTWPSVCKTDGVGLMFGMSGSEVRVTAVVAAERQPHTRTTTYLVTFSCGCRYSEERETSLPRRTVGSAALCYGRHDEPRSSRRASI